jgi:ABC-type lipoprotein export system ATPase subunit
MMPQQAVEQPNALAIEAADVWRAYQVDSREVLALRGIRLQIRVGSLVALKGRSGSGKTTLLNCIGGLDRPTSGMVRVFGSEIARMDDRQLTRWRRERVGFIFQSFGLLPTISAYENVELALRLAGMGYKSRHARTLQCLELVGLSKWLTTGPTKCRAANSSEWVLRARSPTGRSSSWRTSPPASLTAARPAKS